MFLKEVTVPVPEIEGKIVIRNGRTVEFETERVYQKKTQNTRVKRKVIGKIHPYRAGIMYPNEAYFTDDSNEHFKIPSEKAAQFIDSEYGEILFDSSTHPTLKLADGTEVIPKKVAWYYRNSSNGWNTASSSGDVKTGMDPVQLSKQLTLNFNNEPDDVRVKISREGEIIYDGSYQGLSPDIIGEKTATLAVDINAAWDNSSEKSSYGEIAYSFLAEVTAPAEFYLGQNEIQQGELVAITGRNIRNISDIEFRSEPDLGYVPTFFKVNDYVVALVPVSLETEAPQTYTFTLTVKGVPQDLTLSVRQRDNFSSPTTNNDATLEVVNRTRTNATMEAFNNALKTVSLTNDPGKYFTGRFLEPVDVQDMGIRGGYGRRIRIVATGTEYLNHGVDTIAAYSDRNVLAANAGKVVYVGEQVYSGKLVIIDHGLGLKTWYMHLGNISVALGDTVEIGQVIGTVGNSGFCVPGSLHYCYTVNGVYVSPYQFENSDTNGLKIYLVD